jgi:peptidyl-prolyl cis-trans isomerase SurA
MFMQYNMERKMPSKKIASLLCAGFVCLAGKAQSLPDSVVMTVGNKVVPLPEFVFIAQKNNEADFSDPQQVREYVELFKNFKLKVVEAESMGIDTTETFKKELNTYLDQLKASYLSDKTGEETAAKVVYDRGNELLEFSYILFRMPRGNTLMKDTLTPYREAMAVYERLKKGEDLDAVGKALFEADKEEKREKVAYEYVPTLPPMQAFKALEKALYALPVGELSLPIRTSYGYFIAKVRSHKPNRGLVQAAHILIGFKADSITRSKEETLALAQEVYQKVQGGEDFAQLAGTYSNDTGSASRGGVLRAFGQGEMVFPFEEAAFALTTPGEVSGLVETRFGYHIIKLIEKLPRSPFDTEKQSIMQAMAKSDYNFELYKSFDDRMRKEYEYVFYPDAYRELLELCNEEFPGDQSFYEKAKDMDKTLFTLQGHVFPQKEFAYYMANQPFSAKPYAPDFMQEVYDIFLRELTTSAEQKTLAQKHPEYAYLSQEYRDGILLFEISNREVWTKPMEEQPAIETKWVEELNKKYPVVINWDAINKLQK